MLKWHWFLHPQSHIWWKDTAKKKWHPGTLKCGMSYGECHFPIRMWIYTMLLRVRWKMSTKNFAWVDQQQCRRNLFPSSLQHAPTSQARCPSTLSAHIFIQRTLVSTRYCDTTSVSTGILHAWHDVCEYADSPLRAILWSSLRQSHIIVSPLIQDFHCVLTSTRAHPT